MHLALWEDWKSFENTRGRRAQHGTYAIGYAL